MKNVYLLLICVLAFSSNTLFAQLPQDYAYQRTLYDYLGTLEKKDFEVTLEPLKVDPSYFSSDDEIYRAWLYFGYEQNQMTGSRGLKYDASHFTLDAIEAGGRVNMTVGKSQFMNPTGTAFYADWNYEGNPHYGKRAVKLRAFVAVAVDMMMQDQDHERGKNRRGDFLSLQLIRWAYAYGVAKDELPQNVRDAYEQGLVKMFKKLERWGPTGTHADMDVAAMPAVLYAAKFVESKDLTARAHRYIDRLMEDYYSNAGYIDHGSAYDAGYNGISLYFMNWAAQVSDYPPLVDALKQMSKLKGYLTFTDPDGNSFSPFHSNPSSGSDAPHDLWGPYYREPGIAKYSDDAVYLALRGGQETAHSPSAMIKRMNGMLQYFNDSTHRKGFATPSSKAPGPWRHEHWIDGNSVNATARYYENGLYKKFRSLKSSNSPLTKPPFERNREFTESFADKYLSVKRSTYGTVIFNDRLSWWTGEGKTETINGFGGGNLSAFWTTETGSVLLGGTRTAHSGGLDLKDWEIWPIHALSGETADGKAFSSAIQRYPEANYDLNGDTKTVTITGDLTNIYSDPRDGLQGEALYERVFTIKENGIEVTTSFKGDGSNSVNELHEILPVYRRNATYQSSTTATKIEFKSDGNWQQASTDFTEVSSIRLTRFSGQVYIDFKNPVRVKLSSQDFYQDPDKIRGLHARNIMIDLLETGGEATELKDTSVTYFMRSSKAEPNDWGDEEDNNEETTDSTPPQTEVYHTPEKPNDSQKIILQASASDAGGISKITLFFEGDEVKSCNDSEECTMELGPVGDGTYSYWAVAADNSGNETKTSNHELIVSTDDTTPPELNISHSPDQPDNSQEVTFTAEASDGRGIKEIAIFMDGDKLKSCTDTGNCTITGGPYADGSYSYYAKATDTNGNVNKTAEKKVTVKTEAEDTTAPKVEITHSPENPDNSQEVTFTAEASDGDGIKTIAIFMGGDKLKSCTDTTDCTITGGPYKDGTYTYYAKATDTSGNVNETTEKSVTVKTEARDTTPPEVDISHSPSDPYENEIVTFTANVNDNSGIGSIEIFIDGQSQKKCTNTTKCIFKKDAFQAGSYKYYVRATDNASGRNQSQSETKTVNIVKEPASNAPPENVEVKLQQKQNYLESEVDNISDPDGDIVNINYDWRLNGESIAVINFPFDVQTDPQQQGKVTNYTSDKNDGLTGTGKATPKWIPKGQAGGAIKFDGVNDFVQVPSDKSLETLNHFTVETWVRHDDWGDDWASIISKPFANDSWQSPWAVFKLSRYSGKDNLNFQISVGDNEAVSLQSGQEIPSDKWTHIAGTYDGKSLKLYINGKLDTELYVGKPLVKNTTTNVFIGKNSEINNGTAEHFKGTMDELRIFNKALTADQIKNHYAGDYDNLSLSLTKANEKWEVAVTANDSKSRTKATTSNRVITREKEIETAGSTISIFQNYPNPFKSSTTLKMNLEEKETMSIKIYDTLGRHIRTVFEGEMEAGDHKMSVDGQNLSSGIYFCRFVMKDEIITKKMMLVK